MSKQIYSASRLSTYESCPLKYKFRYIDKITSKEESIEAFLGSRVHDVLHTLYRDLQPGEDPSLPDLLNDYREQWGQHWHDQVKIVKQDFSVDSYKQFGERCLGNYYQAHKPFNYGQVVGLEYQVATSLDPNSCYNIQGYIDRLVRIGSGCYEIHDYKTSGRMPSQEKIDVDRQLALYQIAIEGMWPDAKEIELVWHYLAFGRERRSRRTPTAIERLKSSTIALIDHIEADTEFKPIKTNLCHWCAYKNVCPLWSDHPDSTHVQSIKAYGNGRSMEAQTAVDGGGIDLQSISRDALREAIVTSAEHEGAKIRVIEYGQLSLDLGEPMTTEGQPG